MIGTDRCVYETPCGWCSKWDKKCDKKIPSRGQRVKTKPVDDAIEENIVWQPEATKECEYCATDYNQEISAMLTRYHSSDNQSMLCIPVYYCPYCGRKLD